MKQIRRGEKKAFPASNHPKPHSGERLSFLSGFSASILVGVLILTTNQGFVFPQGGPIRQVGESELIWDIRKKSETPIQSKTFIEANPSVPDHAPDKSEMFSFKDQQAANPLTKDQKLNSKIPKVEGTKRTQKIVETESQTSPPPPRPEITDFFTKSADPANSPIDDHRQMSAPKSVNASKSNLAKLEKASSGFYSEKKTLSDNSELVVLGDSGSPENEVLGKINPKDPKPVFASRPKISPKVIQGPVLNSIKPAPRIGSISVECRFHPYGVYVQEMLQAIEEQWGQLVRGSLPYLGKAALPGRISLQFTLEMNGRIRSLIRIDQEGNSLASDLCRQAISSRAPFGEWSEEMKKDFGSSDLVTIHFSYY